LEEGREEPTMGITPLDRAFFLERPLPFLLFLPVTSLGGGHACPFRWLLFVQDGLAS